MDDKDLKRAGEDFRIGEDLYGVSISQLKERLQILLAESERIKREIAKKSDEKRAAEDFFRKN